MKIKRVKISGFRAFQKEEDATFSFVDNEKIMDFASIYAPNGFGKTSFFDAVEWGITGKIERMDRMVDFDKMRRESDGLILLNKGSSKGRVVVETSNKTFNRTIPKKVYKYKDDPENEYFRDQVLTQDLLSAFLKEEKAEKRYEKFVEIDDKLNEYALMYKKIAQLLDFIKDEQSDLQKNKQQEEDKLKKEIDFGEELKKFDEINEMIAFLKEYNENIELVDKESYNRTDYDNLSRQIGVRLISLENDLLKTSDRKETIVTAREGRDSKTNNILGIYSYYQNKQEEQKLLSDIKIIKSVLGWLNEQNKNSRELEACQESIQKKQNNLYRAREINLKYVLFQEFKEQIELLDKNIKDTKSMNLDLENKISDIGSENNKLNEDLVRLNGMLNRDREKLYSLPALQNRYEKALKDIDNHKKNLKTTVDSIEKEEKKQDELSSVLRKFSYYESKVEDDVELLIEFDRLKDLEELITDLIKTTENLKILRKDIDAVQIKIDNQNQFNQELTRLINSGMDIINKSRSSSCPLCDQDYKTFENLTENILSNKALDSQLKVLLNEKNEKEVKLNNLEAKVDANRKNINKKILELKRPIINNLNIGKNSVEKLSLKKEEYLMKLEENQSLIDNAEKVLDGFKSFEELAEKLKNDNQRRVEKVNEISEQIKTNTQLIQEHKEKIEAHKIRLNVLESRAKEYRFLDDYLEVKNYFIKELNTEKTDKEIIINRITKIEQELDELGKKKKEYLIKLDDLKGKLENYPLDKQKYISELDEQNTKLNSVRKTLEIFEKQDSNVNCNRVK